MSDSLYEESGSAEILGENNDTDASGDGTEHHVELSCPPTVHVIIPILYLFIALVGLFANFVVVYIIVILKEHLKTVTNVYVVQLAVADFMFLFILPFQATALFYGYWNHGVAICKISQSVQLLNYYASILFLTVMSIDRYLAINHAMNATAARFRSRRAVGIISVIVWALSFLCVIFILIKADVVNCSCVIVFHEDEPTDYYYGSGASGNSSSYNYENGDYAYHEADNDSYNTTVDYEDTLSNEPGHCSLKKIYEISLWIVCNFILAFVVPLLVISLCYAQIILKISKPMAVGSKSHKSNRTRKRVTVMVIALVTVFIVCWLPYHSFNLSRVNDSQLNEKTCSALIQFTLVLAYLSSALNPFLYTFLGTNFRKRWSNAIGRTRSFRPSFGSRSDYVQGHAKRSRRKSSKVSLTGHKCQEEDTLSLSNVTKHTIVPNNAIIQKNEEDAV